MKITTRLASALLGIGLAFSWPSVPPPSAIGLRPQEGPGAYYEDAQAQFAAGEYRAAEIQLKNALRADPDHLPSRLLLGQTYLRLDNPAAAEKELARAGAAGADPATVLPLLGQAYLDQRRHAELLERLPAPTQPGANSAELLVLRGKAHLALGQVSEADFELQQASRRAPEAAEPVFGQAQVALVRGDTRRAEELIDLVTERDPSHAEAWQVTGDLRVLRRDLPGAVAAYDRAVSLAPDRPGPRNSRAAVLTEMGEDTPALADVDHVLGLEPHDPEAAFLKARLLVRAGEPEGAHRLLEGAVAYLEGLSPEALRNIPAAQRLLGVGHYALRNYEKARAHLARYLELDPGHVATRELLGLVLMRQGEAKAAVQVLEPAARQTMVSPGLLALLGRAYLAADLPAMAASAFERAAALSPEDPGLRAELAVSKLAGGRREEATGDLQTLLESGSLSGQTGYLLGLVRLESGDLDAALQVAAQLQAREPDNPFGPHLAGVAHALKGDGVTARRYLERALELRPRYTPSELSLARLDQGQGKLAAARERYDRLLARHPDSVEARIGLTQVAEAEGRPEQAVADLEHLRGAGQLAFDQQIRLGTLYLRQGQGARALELIGALPPGSATRPEVLELTGRAHLALGRPDQARVAFRSLYGALQGSPEALHRLSQLQVAAADPEGARWSLDKALSVKPELPLAEFALGQLDLRAGQLEQTRTRARGLRNRAGGPPLADTLEGDVLVKEGRYAEAAKSYDAAQAAAPSAAVALRLYAALRAAGLIAPALAALEDWTRSHPADLTVRRTLAVAYLETDRLDAARAAHEELLRGSPRDPAVLNNLASIYERSGDPRALEHAERALALAPDSAAVLDTVGWILVRRGDPTRALPYLREAQARASDSPEVQFHLASALERIGRRKEAESLLRTALASGRPFAEVEDAKALLKNVTAPAPGGGGR